MRNAALTKAACAALVSSWGGSTTCATCHRRNWVNRPVRLLRVHRGEQLEELRLHLRSSAAVVRFPMVRWANSHYVPNPIRPPFSERLDVVCLDIQPTIVHTEPLPIAQLATSIRTLKHRKPNGWIAPSDLRRRRNPLRAVRAKQVMLVGKALRGRLCDRRGGTARLSDGRCLALQSAYACARVIRRDGPRYGVQKTHFHERAVFTQRRLVAHVAFVDDHSHIAT